MKILLISDTHNRPPQIYDEDIDILIHCGDATNSGSKREFQMFAEWLDSIKAKTKLFIAGNHEVFFFRDIQEKGKEVLKEYLPRDVTVLINEGIQINGLNIFGYNITPPVFKDKIYWAWEEFDNERKESVKLIPENLDLLITHGPCHGILDQVPGTGSVGCSYLKQQVELVKPKYHIFGHIHEQGGLDFKSKDTTFLNVAQNKKILKL